MKKIISLLVISTLLLCCCGCNSVKEPNTSENLWDEWLVSDIPSSSEQDNSDSNLNESEDAEMNTQSSSSSSSTTTEKEEYVEHGFKYLENTYYQLVNEKNLTVGFLGGSVTDGYGASNQAEKGWPRLVVNELQTKFSAYVMEERKSIGGTGSALAAFRYEHDLKAAKPDLLFIEFAINDNYQGYSYDEVVRYSESIVRKAYSLNPYIDIIYVLTLDSGTKDSDYEQLKAHRDVANKYGLMCIKLGDGVFAEIKNTATDFSHYVPDGVHPNDRGYQLYANLINKAIMGDFPRNGVAKAKLTKKTLPAAMSDYMQNPQIVTADNIDLKNANGWSHKADKSTRFSKDYGGYITVSTPGSKLNFEFNGTDFGILYHRSAEMGKISIKIDTNEPVIVDGNKSSSSDSYKLLKKVESGKHTVEIEFLGKQSTEFRINALLIN